MRGDSEQIKGEREPWIVPGGDEDLLDNVWGERCCARPAALGSKLSHSMLCRKEKGHKGPHANFSYLERYRVEWDDNGDPVAVQ